MTVMGPAEIKACENHKALAHERVRAFFDSCVPQHRRRYFQSVAEKYHKELMDEVLSLRQFMDAPPTNASFYESQCNRYVVVSKKIIRLVSFKLARSVLL